MTAQEPTTEDERDDLKKIREALAGLRFGEVKVVVQDGVVVQVERIERVRVLQRSYR